MVGGTKPVNDVQPSNVWLNMLSAPVVIPLNNPDGIDVNDVQLLNVPLNIFDAPVVYPLNNVAGIDVIDVPRNDSVNIGHCPEPDPKYGNILDKLPSIDAIFACVPPTEKKLIAAVVASVLYPVAVPPNCIVLTPRVEYEHVYVF